MRSKPVEWVAGGEKAADAVGAKGRSCRGVQTRHCGKQMRQMTPRLQMAPTVWRILQNAPTEPIAHGRGRELSRLADRARTESHSATHFSHLVCFRLHSVEQPSSSSCPGASQHQTLHWTVQFTPICYRFESLVCYFLRRVFGLYSPLRCFLFCALLPIDHWWPVTTLFYCLCRSIILYFSDGTNR